MHCSLMVVGACDGAKLTDPVAGALNTGRIILIEPVPHIFERLGQRYGGRPEIELRRLCVALADGPVTFYAPRPEGSIFKYAHQMGSLDPSHAAGHDPRLAAEFVPIAVEGTSFASLIEREGITSIDLLWTDAEGYDATLLRRFPFHRFVPKRIHFEFRHADGPLRVGANLGQLLILLDGLGYTVRCFDHENMLAIHSTWTAEDARRWADNRAQNMPAAPSAD